MAALLRPRLATPLLPALLALLCLAAYAAQLGLGRWQSDEFTLLINQRDWGREVLPTRLAYAPRPFSEGILFLYAEAVLRLGRPLIAPFLAMLWAGVLAASLLAARHALPPGRLRWPAALVLAAAPFAFVLVTNNVTETFYWPMAAAAYLPVGGAATVLLFLLSKPLNRQRRLGCGAALMVAATSSEMGAALAIGFAAAAAVEAASRPATPFRFSAALQQAAWWMLPGLAGLAALATLLSFRTSVIELGSDTQPYTGRAAASIGLAVGQLALDVIGSDGAGSPLATLGAPLAILGAPLATLGALTAKALFAFGFTLVWRQADPAGAMPGRWHAVLAASLAVAALFSIAAAYYHYGALCCERQATMRHWLIDLLAVLATSWALARWPPRNKPPHKPYRTAWPSVLLALSLCPALFRIDGLRQGYANLQFAADARARTWRSGQQAGAGQMVFYLPPDRDEILVRGTALPIGSFQAGPGAPMLATEIGRFFGKAVVVTCHPWQQEHAWQINGELIPACPPHPGPPGATTPSGVLQGPP